MLLGPVRAWGWGDQAVVRVLPEQLYYAGGDREGTLGEVCNCQCWVLPMVEELQIRGF